MEEIRVLVVDDSAFMRKMISGILTSNEQIRVIGSARNGEEAIEKTLQLKPDVITLDIEMPVMNGISVLRHLMMHHPIPVVMVSSLSKKGADLTMEALELGAVDFIAKPSGSISLDIAELSEEIITKVITAAHSNLKVSHQSGKKKVFSASKKTLIAIGTSTGGPKALQKVLPMLPVDFPVPLVIVQHMPQGFTRSLADRLNVVSAITVKEAENGEKLKKGTAYIAPGGYQLSVKQTGENFFCEVTDEPAVNNHRPSVDYLYYSLAELKSIKVVPVILTGMGSDGTNGLIELKTCKSDTCAIVESKKTSIVYGMPQSAVKTGLVDQEEELQNIGSALVTLIRNTKELKPWN